MRYVVYGAGAVGGVIGANLHLAEIPVTLVARGAHLEALRRDGLTLETPVDEHRLDIAVVANAGEVAWTDDTVVLLSVKTHQTRSALDDLVAHAPAGTPVVCAQNGVANETMVLRLFEHTYGICVMLPSGHVEAGRVVQRSHPTPGILDIGRFPEGVDPVAEAVAADLITAGFESLPQTDIMARKHRKLIMNLGNAVQACCRPGADADALIAIVSAEGEQVLAAAGVPLVSEDADIQRRGDIIRTGDRHPKISGGSTWQSVARGTGDVETDYLSGEIVLLGRLHGVPVPANELMQRTALELARTRGPASSLDAAVLLAQLP